MQPLPSPTAAENPLPETDVLTLALDRLQDHEHDASRWLEVAGAFRALGQPVQAIDACEACLKLDPQQIEGWFMIAELAAAVGHEEIAAESYAVARQLAPEDPRLAAAGFKG